MEKLPFLGKHEAREVELTEEELKAQRIEFHRSRVRNGPVSFRELTTGQIRRERKRALDRQTRKARRRQVRLYLRGQHEAAILRGQLQLVGVLNDHAGLRSITSTERAYLAVMWIHARFGEFHGELGYVPNTPEAVRASLQSALNRWESLVGLPPSRLDTDARHVSQALEQFKLADA